MKNEMMKNRCLFAFFVFAISCSHKGASDKRLNSPHSLGTPRTEAGQRTDPPRALSPLIDPNTADAPFIVSSGGGAEAIVAMALLGAAAGLSQVFTKEVPREDLNGTCSYGDPKTPILSPCVYVIVQLLNEKNESVATTSTDRDGRFRFYIPPEQRYVIQITDRKGRTARTKNAAGRSDFVRLYLNP